MIIQAMLLMALVTQAPADLPPGVTCDDTSSYTQIRGMFPSRPVVVGKQIIRPAAPASPGARIECTLDVRDRELVFYQREAGEIDGIPYRISYLDGSGGIGNDTDFWGLTCNVDPIEDTRSCFLVRRNLVVMALAGGPAVVKVGKNHFPGSESVIRLDKGAPFRSRADGIFGESKKILAGMEACGEIVLRYREWPSEAAKDEVVSCAGFRQARTLLQWAVKSIPPP